MLVEPVPGAFIAGIRDELQATPGLTTKAARLPWRDDTQSALAEMRFDSLCNWLPKPEADGLREAFGIELDRLYALEPDVAVGG